MASVWTARSVLGGGGGFRNPLRRGNREERGQDYPVDANGPEEKKGEKDGEKGEKQPEC